MELKTANAKKCIQPRGPLLADFVVKVGFDLSDEDVLVFAGGQSGTF